MNDDLRRSNRELILRWDDRSDDEDWIGGGRGRFDAGGEECSSLR